MRKKTPKTPEIPLANDQCPSKEPAGAADFRSHLPEVVAQMVATCNSHTCFEHIAAEPLPSRSQAVAILKTCRELIFPGYFGNKGIDRINLEYRIGLEISGLFNCLAEEIANAIRHECTRHGQICQHCEEAGQEKAFLFLERLPQLRQRLASDVQAAYQGDPAAAGFDEIIFSYPGLHAITIYRIANELYRLEVPILPRIMTEHAHSITGIDIHPGAQIGESFFIDHGTGVVIGQTAVLGKRVKLYQGVTLGALAFRRDEAGELERHTKRHPTLEDDVTVYAGSTILGGETIVGARSVIGGNIWLTHSVPPDTKVVLNPPELVYKKS
ncbi:serine O-acetyltransferase EpsC [Desulfurivibrio dismutans]|uniref:serine O-acetyltransferase EpsC n=1 Tax=Desulfurivibrio dismutans TaxID=1398908 RepID=UPI0023DB571D|nr:serine O-acetyltransferase EpsC [Desulfurivibrio alkaliphilus]MDF1615553.1 serine acetyltransferase [Desulfurivibrio alkaliphilus]